MSLGSSLLRLVALSCQLSSDCWGWKESFFLMDIWLMHDAVCWSFARNSKKSLVLNLVLEPTADVAKSPSRLMLIDRKSIWRAMWRNAGETRAQFFKPGQSVARTSLRMRSRSSVG